MNSLPQVTKFLCKLRITFFFFFFNFKTLSHGNSVDSALVLLTELPVKGFSKSMTAS